MFSDRISKTVVVEEDKSDLEDENSTQFIALSYLFLEMSTLMTLYIEVAS
jgi:hypothetical protein